MTALIRSIIPARPQVGAFDISDWIEMLQVGGFPLTMPQTMSGSEERIDPTFEGLVQGAYRTNGIAFACMLARFRLFSEARFQFQQIRGGQPGALFGTPELAILESPEPGRTTGDLLSRIILEADLAGTSFVVRRPGRMKTLRPDWTAILIGSTSPTPRADIGPQDVDAEYAGVVYVPGGFASGNDPETFAASEVAIFAPTPDPTARYRGMSWLMPVLREIMGDSAATTHKQKFFEHAATPNMIVTLDPKITIERAREWIQLFDQEHAGVLNAYKTAYLGGGATSNVVGKDFQQMDFRNVREGDEVRIAAASGMHPVVMGLSEALHGSALNEGNFTASRRLVADGTLRPLWRNLSGSLAPLMNVPAGSQLWYDDRTIPFLAEDRKDAAEVQASHATSIRTLVDGGFVPDAVIDAITAGDMGRLRGQHTGFLPVQLQPPGAGTSTDGAPAATALYQRVWDAPVVPATSTDAVEAIATFWATGMPSGPLEYFHVERGARFTAGDRVVLSFPQFFAPLEAAGSRPALTSGPMPIVSREAVIATRERLRADGQPAGYAALAAALGVSVTTVRRRLGE